MLYKNQRVVKYLKLICTLFLSMFPISEIQADNNLVKHTESTLGNHKYELATDSIKCEITGTVINRPESKEAVIIEAMKDARVNKHVRIPIVDGKYSYTLHDDYPRTYSVFFDDEEKHGEIRIRNFYTGNGYVNIISHNEENEDDDKVISDIEENNIADRLSNIENGRYKLELNNLYAILDSLYQNKRAYTSEINRLDNELANLGPGEKRDSIQNILRKYFEGPKDKRYSTEYLKCDSLLKEVLLKRDSAERAYITENPSLVGLFAIKYALHTGKYIDWKDISGYINIFENYYSQPMQNHPYVEEIKELIAARGIAHGNKYPDYTVRREDGTTEKIKNLISGKTAVIDLWASWCGPCRYHSKQLIPVYEKYKDKGFTVVAIAREDGSCEQMNRAMKKDGYPWESFVDLNDQDKIWRINNAGNGGGKIILVNSEGIIEATDIPIEEIEVYLKKLYGY